MEIRFTPEQEAELAHIASKTGTEPERLVRDAALRLLQDEGYVQTQPRELPVVHMGPMKPLHRRDIYEDAS